MGSMHADQLEFGKLKLGIRSLNESDIIKYANAKYCGRIWATIQLFFNGKGIISVQGVKKLLKNHPELDSLLKNHPYLKSSFKIYSLSLHLTNESRQGNHLFDSPFDENLEVQENQKKDEEQEVEDESSILRKIAVIDQKYETAILVYEKAQQEWQKERDKEEVKLKILVPQV